MEIVYGNISNTIALNELRVSLLKLNLNGTLYLGYPILASAEEKITIDALLLSPQYGCIVFHIINAENIKSKLAQIKEEQTNIFFAVKQKLLEQKELRKEKDIAILPVVVGFSPTTEVIIYEDIKIISSNDIKEFLESLPIVEEQYVKPLFAAIQRVSTLKPLKKRKNVKSTNSKGAKLKIIEKEISNLDQWQNQAAIETPNGPQCIRGLAGSGKTVVLALKAAYLHATNPELNIVVTFHTRSLYQQFENLIRRFYYDHMRDEPDWSKINILHSWGSRSEKGVYSEIALNYGIEPSNFNEAKLSYRNFAFAGICDELLQKINKKKRIPIYDVILIDEAQDFPKSFFQILYHLAITNDNKIIWAYDELQNLSDYTFSGPEKLFGPDKNGKPLVRLKNIEGEPRQDIVLPICYRNTPWALTIAHALGFGIYRGELVQLFEDMSDRTWRKIGYEIISGTAKYGEMINLKRREDTIPSYFNDLLTPDEAVTVNIFKNEKEQAKYVAKEIKKNLKEDELEATDILLIFLNPFTVRKDSILIRDELNGLGINSHIAGVTSSKDILFVNESIAITGIFRAKGNEAPMVYILNSDYGYEGPELIKRRNILFTAITRSKAWVNICGVGENMEKLSKEIDQVRDKKYHLEFPIPPSDELKRLRKIYGDISEDEKEKIKNMDELINLISKGEFSPENLPKELREKLKKIFGS